MKLAFGSDHAGFEMRRWVAGWATTNGHEVTEVGAPSSEPYDYPDASDAVAELVLSHQAELGVLICGTGIGVCIRANRHNGIRAAQCYTPEMAAIARQHNHANVLCMGERLMTQDAAVEVLKTFLATAEDPDARHQRRVAKLDRDTEEYLERTR